MKFDENKNEILRICGARPGKRIAVFCGVHGDEPVGMLVVDHLRKNLAIDSGEVFLVYANPKAIEKKARQVERNLNRSFIRTSAGSSYEEKRAKTLMDLLDTCDAMLDIHSMGFESDQHMEPFVICEQPSYEAVEYLPFGKIFSGFCQVESGSTDGYMFKNNKPGICLELGHSHNPEKYIAQGIQACMQFFQYFGLIRRTPKKLTEGQEFFQIYYRHKVKSKAFRFEKNFKTFDSLKKGEILGYDGTEKIIIKEEGILMFPGENMVQGDEAFFLAKKVN
jgi:succinylglutamate desuccinylase